MNELMPSVVKELLKKTVLLVVAPELIVKSALGTVVPKLTVPFATTIVVTPTEKAFPCMVVVPTTVKVSVATSTSKVVIVWASIWGHTPNPANKNMSVFKARPRFRANVIFFTRSPFELNLEIRDVDLSRE